MSSNKADYGIDAPNVVRNLFLVSLGTLALSFFSFHIHSTLLSWFIFLSFILSFLSLFATGCWMLYGMKVAKPRIISKMVQTLGLTGNEKLLDLGCGRGILLCEAAKQLSQGEAHGIDLWILKDQSGNRLEKTLENAEREGVREKVTVHTGDIRALPFADSMFDVIVSCLCLHNIENKQERETALLEMIRVLKSGGKFAITDIQCVKEYTDFLLAQGIIINTSKPNYSYCPPLTTIEGKKP